MAVLVGRDTGPSPATIRQQAFQQGLNQMAQGASGLGDAMEQKAKTERQLALQDRAEKMDNLKTSIALTQQSGQQVTPEQVATFKKTGAFEEQLGPNEMGPPAPSGLKAILGGISEKQRVSSEQKAADRELDRQYKQKKIDTMGKSKSGMTFSERKALKQMDIDARKQARIEEKQVKKNAKLDPRQRLDKMGAEARNKVGSIASGIMAINQMKQALKAGYGPEYVDANTPLIGGLVSDTPYTKSERVLSEVVGRLQSGGAINAEEGKRFLAMGPRANDKGPIREAKIKDQMKFLENKLTAFGFKKEEMPTLGFDIGDKLEPLKSETNIAEEAINTAIPTATASSPEEAIQKASQMSKQDKIKFLQGN